MGFNSPVNRQEEPTLSLQNALRPKPKKKRLWYVRMGIASVLFSGVAFTLCVLTDELGNLLFFDWYQFFIPIPAFFGNHLSGYTYLGKTKDQLSEEDNDSIPHSLETKGTITGISLGLVVGIGLVAAQITLNGFTGGALQVVTHLFGIAGAIIGSIGSFGGLGHRIGSSIIKKPKPLVIENEDALETTTQYEINKEKRFVLFGITLGLVTSIALWFSGMATFTLVVGVTSFMTGGAAVPFWILGTLFVIGYTGTNASSFDYLSKMKRFIEAFFLSNSEASKIIKGKFHEFRGASIGVTLGLIIATIIIIALLVTQPYLTTLIGAVAVLLVCTSILGGIFSRAGQIIDKEKNRSEEPPPPAEEQEAQFSSPAFRSSHSLLIPALNQTEEIVPDSPAPPAAPIPLNNKGKHVPRYKTRRPSFVNFISNEKSDEPVSCSFLSSARHPATAS